MCETGILNGFKSTKTKEQHKVYSAHRTDLCYIWYSRTVDCEYCNLLGLEWKHSSTVRNCWEKFSVSSDFLFLPRMLYFTAVDATFCFCQNINTNTPTYFTVNRNFCNLNLRSHIQSLILSSWQYSFLKLYLSQIVRAQMLINIEMDLIIKILFNYDGLSSIMNIQVAAYLIKLSPF